MNTLGQRIRASREALAMQQGDLADRVGVKSDVISNWERDVNKPNVDKLVLLCKALDVKLSYLLDYCGGVSSEASPSPTWSTPLVTAYEKSPVITQSNVCKLLDLKERVVPGAVPAEEEDDPEGFRKSVQPAAAGTGVYLGPEEFEAIKVVAGCLPREASFGVPVSGDSMEPKYHDGDILIVGKEKARPGQVGVFTMDGLGYVKVLRDGYLESLNPEYDDIPMDDSIICNGAVIGVLDPEDVVRE